MRRNENKFATPAVLEAALSIGASLKAARLARNITQTDLCERARISPVTLIKIERGDVSVTMSSWFMVMEQLGMLAPVQQAITPAQDKLGESLRKLDARQRARHSAPKTKAETYDF